MIKKYKKIIITLLIILLIISFIILTVIIQISKNNIKNNDDDDSGQYSSYQEEKNIDLSEKDTSTTTLNILLNCINNNTNYTFIKDIYVQRNDNINVYAVYGIQNNKNIYYIISLDYNNFSYNIKQVTEDECNNIKDGKENDYIKITNIEINNDNTFELNVMSDVQTSAMYYNIIKNVLNSEPEVLYNLLLDDEYKQKRFSNIEAFNEFVNQNKSKYNNMKLSKYAKYKYDGYVQYVCLDNNGDYFIINNNVDNGEYKVLLDTYTVDQQEFIKKYDSVSDNEKAGYDINKFFEAINAKDYKYAYNCLAESFKQNNFTTQNQFENYIKNNFYNKNDVKYSNYRKEGNYYIYTVNIINSEDTTKSVQKDFIVNLKENRQFEMSFSVE